MTIDQRKRERDETDPTPISARTLAQRARREKENNLKTDKLLQKQITNESTSLDMSTFISFNSDSKAISARTLAQRVRRERERNTSHNKPVQEQTVNQLSRNDLHTNTTLSSTSSDSTPIASNNSTTPSSKPISARTLAQRARREREKNMTHDKPVQEHITTQLSWDDLHSKNTEMSSPRSDSSPISATVPSQHIRNEIEKNLLKEKPMQEPIGKKLPLHNSIPILPAVLCIGSDSKVISARTLAQRARREREKASSSTTECHNKRKRVESNPICGDQFNNRKLAQRARRQREKGIAIYSMTENQLHSTVLQQPNISTMDKGKNKVIEMISTRRRKEIIYFLGSSSIGNPNKEHEVHRVEYIEDPEPDQHTYMDDVENLPSEHEESDIILEGRHSLGEMTFKCEFCGALHWLDEKLVKSSEKRPQFGTCCHHGKIKLPPPVPLPPPLHALFEGNDARSKSFRQHKRSYNAANAFTSLGVQIDDRIVGGHGPRSFSIHGELHHRVGTLLPDLTKDPVYSQLYIYDANVALDYRQGRNPHLRRDVLKTIQDTLLQTNELCRIYKQAFEVLSQNDDGTNDIFARLHYKAGTDRRRYNVPTSKEIAVVLPGDGLADQGYRDIILHMRNHGLKRIHECHPLYLPSHYVLFFPHGELGWSPDLTQWDVTKNCPTEDDRLTQLQYHAYQLYERDSIYSPILRGGNLFEEYIVDAYAAYDQNRLHYVYQHQDELRSEASGGLADMVNDGHNPNEIGQRFILPSSHPGSPRHMYELYQDAMAITRHYKHPDIFLTVTANPNWPEIKKKLKPDETVTDRPDLVARVFELKRKAIMKEIIKKKVFGKVAAYVYTIEFQKRGLPHIHALLFLKGKHKITTAEQVDKIISAEIPDAIAEPALFQTVMKCMIHGPCGENNNSLPCMQNPLKKCSAKFPRKWNPKTNMDVDGYPNYMRRDNGKTYKVRGCEVDNRDVVPYNPHLSKMFNCHINVEVCSSVRAVKYITKYIHKGFDRTTMVLNGANNEIQIYIDGRYIGAPEAAWRLFQFAMHAEDPNVVRLALHLPGMHHVVYNPNDTREQILAKTKKQASTLMGFFKYCRKHRSARKYTYQEFPQHYVWKKDKREWKKRKQGRAIGRLYFAAPNSGERFYLRLLLTSVKGPTSFKNLRTLKDRDGRRVTYNTFKEACIARGLLEDDEEWEKCLEEAALMKTGYQLRRLFCIILLECSPTSPEILWSKFALKISDDVPHILRTRFSIDKPTDEQVMDYGLFLLEKMLEEFGKYLSDFPSMPQPSTHWETPSDNPLISEQLQYQYDQPTQSEAIANITRLNEEQLNAYNLITDSAINGKGKMFFLNGPAGTGKTFVYNSVAATCRSKGKIVIMVASSGIAALLLDGGRTAHSALKIPLQVMEDSVCTIPKHSERAALLKEACLIIWDEVPMQHRHCMEAVERTLRDIRNDPEPFGGITMVLGGDFRQTLPVIPRALREEVVAASVRRSFLWKHFQVITLVRNMRLDVNDQENINFAEYLMEVGSKPEEDIQLPLGITTHNNVDDIISSVYPQLNSKGTATNSYLTERTILSARNEDVTTLNDQILQIFPGDVEEFLSADKIVEDGDDMEGRRYPTELLNAQNHPSMPPFKLRLKQGCPIMLLRNIAPKDGLCNGTRLKVLQCRSRVIEAQILTGNKAGTDVLIPRLTITPTTKELPFKMSRRQFPVRLAFAMTINKSQGQSVKYVGIDLRTPVFSHGQLYVALSRCTSSKRISVILPPHSTNNTTNVVYPEVLL